MGGGGGGYFLVPVSLSATDKKLASYLQVELLSTPEPDDDYEYVEKLEGHRLFHCQDFKKSLEASGKCPCCQSSLRRLKLMAYSIPCTDIYGIILFFLKSWT